MNDHEQNRVIGQHIREIAQQQGLSTRKLAELTGYTQPYLSRRLHGELPFDVNDLAKIARSLRVSLCNIVSVIEGTP